MVLKTPERHSNAQPLTASDEIYNGQHANSGAALPLPEAASSPSIPSIASSQTANEYAELKQLIKKNGLLNRQPRYYTFKIISLVALLSLGVAFLIVVGPSWFQLLNAVFMAFVFTQFGLLGHDAGHRQIFQKTVKNDIVGLLAGDLVLGLSQQWWMDKHNRHHSNPNQHDLDPDIEIPFLSFTEENISTRPPLTQFIVKHQAFFFFPLISLVALDLQRKSFLYVWRKRDNYRTLEMALMLTHLCAYLGLIFWSLGPGLAIPFIIVHQLLWGLYLGSIFAPNHKGMPILEKDSPMNFLRRQVVTARNVKAHPVTDFWYGGLNYQIEHHLFPSMPQKNLRAAQSIVQNFCQERSIPYHETGMLESYREILQSLYDMSLVYRAKK